MEESCLFLNSLREDKDTEKTESEKDENDPKGGMSSVGSMDQLELWVGELRCWWWEVVVGIMGLTGTTWRVDRDGTSRSVMMGVVEELHIDVTTE